MRKVKEKNERIKKILHDLELNEKVFQPEMTVDEKPEMLLEVKDEEVPFEKFITAEEQARLEELEKLEEGFWETFGSGKRFAVLDPSP